MVVIALIVGGSGDWADKVQRAEISDSQKITILTDGSLTSFFSSAISWDLFGEMHIFT
jgi:hypothetical protein